jgi:hypothetical protein
MKAMTWLKIAAGILVTLAAIAAADTRHAQGYGREVMDNNSHAIASRIAACPVAQEQMSANSTCCNKDAKEKLSEEHHSGCCKK